MTTPIRLHVTMEGGSKDDVLARLDAQAEQFFGDEQYRLDGDVECRVLEEVRSIQGQVAATLWEGEAWYVNLR